MAPMFGMIDSKTLQDTIMGNEEYLEKVIEKLPYIGEDYRKEKEKERMREEGEYEEEEEEQNGEGEQLEVEPENESYYEKIKKGVSGYWNSWFGSAGKPVEKVFPEAEVEEHHTIVNVNSPTNIIAQNEKAVAV